MQDQTKLLQLMQRVRQNTVPPYLVENKVFFVYPKSHRCNLVKCERKDEITTISSAE